jgi:hypothetical protein
LQLHASDYVFLVLVLFSVVSYSCRLAAAINPGLGRLSRDVDSCSVVGKR